MLELLKKILRKRELKRYWKSEVKSIFYFFDRIRTHIKSEDLVSAEFLTFEKQYAPDVKTVAEINRICNSDLKDCGFVLNRDNLTLKVLHTKQNKMFLEIQIINEGWNPNSSIFLITEYPKFELKKTTFYKDGVYYPFGSAPLKIPNWDKPMRVIFPLNESNKKNMVEELWVDRIKDDELYLKG